MYLDAVKVVTTDEGGLSLREAIRHELLARLLDSAACMRCVVYLTECRQQGDIHVESERERFRAGCLLFILAAMQVGTEEDVLEALRLIAASKVDTRGASIKDRYERAGMARRRPVKDPRHYDRTGYPDRMRQRLADELYDLVTYADILERALKENGALARLKYL
jgi:hypothetical protein